MTRVGFEITTSVIERAKTVHALERAVAVIGGVIFIYLYFIYLSTLLQIFWQWTFFPFMSFVFHLNNSMKQNIS
jgi:hypothetical protein